MLFYADANDCLMSFLLWSRWHCLILRYWAANRKQAGMLWHILRLARSSADGLSWTCCVISQPSYRNQAWLNTLCLKQVQGPTINQSPIIKLVILLWFCGDLDLNLGVIMPHCVWGIRVMRLFVLFHSQWITQSHFPEQTGYPVFPNAIQMTACSI